MRKQLEISLESGDVESFCIRRQADCHIELKLLFASVLPVVRGLQTEKYEPTFTMMQASRARTKIPIPFSLCPRVNEHTFALDSASWE